MVYAPCSRRLPVLNRQSGHFDIQPSRNLLLDDTLRGEFGPASDAMQSRQEICDVEDFHVIGIKTLGLGEQAIGAYACCQDVPFLSLEGGCAAVVRFPFSLQLYTSRIEKRQWLRPLFANCSARLT